MTVNAYFPARKQYRCDICGRIGFWNELGFDWARFSSTAHDETCPDDMPDACSETCRNELSTRVDDGRIQLPKLRFEACGAVVSKPACGYPLIVARPEESPT